MRKNLLLIGLTLLILSISVPTFAATKKAKDPTIGSADAPVTFMSFNDYQCSFGKQFFGGAFKNIEENYIKTGKVKFVFRNLLITSHKYALPAAKASECAYNQNKFTEMHDKLYEMQDEWSGALGKMTKTKNLILLKKYAKEIGLDAKTFKTCMASKKTLKEVQRDNDEANTHDFTGTSFFVINDTAFSGNHDYENVFKRILDAELAGKTWQMGNEGLIIEGEEDPGEGTTVPPPPPPAPSPPPAPVSPATQLPTTYAKFYAATDSPAGAVLSPGTDVLLGKIKIEATLNDADTAINKVIMKTLDVYMENSGVALSNIRLYPTDNDLQLSYLMNASTLSTNSVRFDLSNLPNFGSEINEGTAKTFSIRANVSSVPRGTTLQFSIKSLGEPGASGTGGTAMGDGDTAPDVHWTTETGTAFYWGPPEKSTILINPVPMGSN